MAKDEHLSLLKQGVDAWNEWRRRSPAHHPNLRGANLSRANLRGVDLSGADLYLANLSEADLREVDLRGVDLSGARLRGAHLGRADLSNANLHLADLYLANLREANLRGAHLSEANLRGANLRGAGLRGADLSGSDLREAKLYLADLSGADLRCADFSEADLSGADLRSADLSEAVFIRTNLANTDFSNAIGLDECKHLGPSTIDFRALSLSTNLPISFLRGCGLPDRLIEYLPSIQNDAIQYYSCFIRYSSKDQMFADRLHADLQNAGVRCWFAPHDLAIDEAIKLREKLLVILSEASIGSDWVEDEVSRAFAEERDRKTTVLFPVRIDDVVMTTSEPWASKLRDQRYIGDFREWVSPTKYSTSLERLLRDLKSAAAAG